MVRTNFEIGPKFGGSTIRNAVAENTAATANATLEMREVMDRIACTFETMVKTQENSTVEQKKANRKMYLLMSIAILVAIAIPVILHLLSVKSS